MTNKFKYKDGSLVKLSEEEISQSVPSVVKVKQFKKAVLKETLDYLKNNTTVDTGLGFSVDGGYEHLVNLQIGLEIGYMTIRSAENTNHDVTEEQFNNIIERVKMNGLAIKRWKWDKENLIDEVQTLEELDNISVDLQDFEEFFSTLPYFAGNNPA